MITVIALTLHLLGDILMPFLVALIFAYLTNPLVNLLQKIHIPRVLGVVLIFLLLIALIALMFIFLIPLFEQQAMLLYKKLPIFFEWIQTSVLPWINQKFGLSLDWKVPDLSDSFGKYWQQATSVAASILRTVKSSGKAIILWVTNILLVPVVLFYLLRDWNKMLVGIEALLPRKYAPVIMNLMFQSNMVLGAFLKGQLLVMLCLGILYSLGLYIIGLDTAFLIGMIAGLVSIVPYLGFIVGILSASVASFIQFHDWWHFAGVLLVFLVAQSIEASVLTPWLVGDKVGLHPVLVIFAILAGGSLFGFIGVLLAIPVTAVMMVFIRYFKMQYFGSRFYGS